MNSAPRSSTFVRVSADEAKDPDLVAGEFSVSRSLLYYGPLAELAAIWRTPPLWGVRHTAPYLHDGRAATLDQAITLHDGEAAGSATSYRKMSANQRSDLRAFVRSLGAP